MATLHPSLLSSLLTTARIALYTFLTTTPLLYIAVLYLQQQQQQLLSSPSSLLDPSRTTFGRLYGSLPRNKHICLLVAHPDDEAMFFAPTLLALTHPALGNHVQIVCMSSGNADGLGRTRKKELVKSGLMLGVRSESMIHVVESEHFPDSMTAKWDPHRVSDTLAGILAVSRQQQAPPPVDILITFDRHGVSAHPNHCALYDAGRIFVQQKQRGSANRDYPTTLYTLKSTSWFRKYLSVLDLIPTLLDVVMAREAKGHHSSPPLYFTSPPVRVRLAQSAMTRAHQSQMRWFRWGWIMMSRYMVLNHLEPESA